jgi:hypothetical protein
MELLICLEFIGLVLAVAGAFATFGTDHAMGFHLIWLGAVLHIIGAALASRATHSFARRHMELLNAAGLPEGSAFGHSEKNSCLAINIDSQTLVISSDGKCKSYRFSDVLEWSAHTATVSQEAAMGNGVAGALGMSIYQVAARLQAEAETGFFITVRDKDCPRWRVEMGRPSCQKRWNAILHRALSQNRQAEMVS